MKTTHKGRRPLKHREFPEISIQTHAFERKVNSLLREQQQKKFAVNLCRIARLRVAAQLIPHSLPVPPGFGLLRNLFRIPCPYRPASGCCATLPAS